jgi:hypothetical protein
MMRSGVVEFSEGSSDDDDDDEVLNNLIRFRFFLPLPNALRHFLLLRL